MTPEELVEAVSQEKEIELSRLGSSRALYGETGGDMSNEQVLRQIAGVESAAATTFERWADEETGDLADAFGTTAEEERRHREAIVELGGGDFEPEEPVRGIQEHLRGVDGSVERLGAFIGRTIIADRSKEQIAGFFVGQGDTDTADVLTGARDDLACQLDRGKRLLERLCDDDEQCWDRAYEAAIKTVEVAYDDYTDNLNSLGIDPKPIC